MFVNKYAPKSLKDIIGHTEQINQIGHWLKSWTTATPEVRGVLVSGPPGIGKTTAVHHIAKALGYKISEYNASDTRSVSVLRNLIALDTKRLVKEVIVMDEIDGISERGGIGELASIIKKSSIPILCIANEKPPKLKPILNVCMDVKFNRPMKTTIATALLKIAAQENIKITKQELETLCEKNGNDIRSILNTLEFYGSKTATTNKDETLRLDLFSATQALFSNKTNSLDVASNLVFVDHAMIPLMIQEAYVSASKNSLEDVVKASEYISEGDLLDTRVHRRNDWSLLPHTVQSYVAAVKTVKGSAPFQIFPQWLGKNSKRLKHTRYIDAMSSRKGCSNDDLRLDYAEPMQTILLKPLQETGDSKKTIQRMDEIRITREDIDNLQEVLHETIELSTKTKTAFTREYNKMHTDVKKLKNIKKLSVEEDEDDSEDEDEKKEEEIDIEL